MDIHLISFLVRRFLRCLGSVQACDLWTRAAALDRLTLEDIDTFYLIVYPEWALQFILEVKFPLWEWCYQTSAAPSTSHSLQWHYSASEHPHWYKDSSASPEKGAWLPPLVPFLPALRKLESLLCVTRWQIASIASECVSSKIFWAPQAPLYLLIVVLQETDGPAYRIIYGVSTYVPWYHNIDFNITYFFNISFVADESPSMPSAVFGPDVASSPLS